MTMTRQEIVNEIERLKKMRTAIENGGKYANRDWYLDHLATSIYYLEKRLDKIDNK